MSIVIVKLMLFYVAVVLDGNVSPFLFEIKPQKGYVVAIFFINLFICQAKGIMV